ncbi:MAG TPA: hypothetical protein VEP93_14635 [Variovorax sp.]|nr:hypothetical protein [Variovorax sp.]
MHKNTNRALRTTSRLGIAGACIAALAACTSSPLVPFGTQGPPLVLMPAAQAGVVDQRARFREIFCAVLEARKDTVPDYRPCDEALTRLDGEPAGPSRPVELGPSKRRLSAMVVPGVGYECFAPWLQPPGTTKRHVEQFGYELHPISVDPLSGTTRNARRIRDALLAVPAEPSTPPRIVLVGYSKGTPDILEALATYPEIRGRIAAVVSVAGAVGGSPLANDATQDQANLIKHFPGATCDSGDNGAVEALRPQTRKAWLAQNPLPAGLRYFSLVTLPQPERVSLILRPSWRKLGQVDARNDSQVIFYDQVVPGSSLLGYLNADHWSIAVPLSRTREVISDLLVTQNAYPREAMTEAILRYVEEDLSSPTGGSR